MMDCVDDEDELLLLGSDCGEEEDLNGGDEEVVPFSEYEDWLLGVVSHSGSPAAPPTRAASLREDCSSPTTPTKVSNRSFTVREDRPPPAPPTKASSPSSKPPTTSLSKPLLARQLTATAILTKTRNTRKYMDFDFTGTTSPLFPSSSFSGHKLSDTGPEVASSAENGGCGLTSPSKCGSFVPSAVPLRQCADTAVLPPTVSTFGSSLGRGLSLSATPPVVTPISAPVVSLNSRFRVRSGGSTVIKLNAPGKFRYVPEDLTCGSNSSHQYQCGRLKRVKVIKQEAKKIAPGDLRERINAYKILSEALHCTKTSSDLSAT